MLMLLLGAILSKVMDITGAARSIASFIIGKLGVKFAIPAIVIAGGLLTYGGVSAMVSCFALYPITLAVFREADMPRKLIPATIGAGIFTWVTMLPGNPQVQNIIPSSFLPTNDGSSSSWRCMWCFYTCTYSGLSYVGVKQGQEKWRRLYC